MKSALRALICLIVAIFSVSSLGPVWADGTIEEWYEVGPNESGIVFIVDGKVSNQEFFLISGGKKLDSVKWALHQPFIKQYRLLPGKYEIHAFKSWDTVSVLVEPKKLTFITFSQFDPHKPYYSKGLVEKNVSPYIAFRRRIVGKFDKKIAALWGPKFIKPKTNQLTFTVRPPWPIPKPEPSPDNGSKKEK